MEKILITGAGPNGFVGRNLAEAFIARGYSVFAPNSKELDLLDTESVATYIENHRIEYLIHSAVHNPRTRGLSGEIDNDLRMFFNLERMAGRLNKMIYFGSGAEFDKRFPIDMAKESDIGKRIPIDPYGIAKYAMNAIARNSRNVYNLRLFGIFGKYEYWQSKFISNLCCKAVYGLPLTVRQNCLFDFFYINDLPDVVENFIRNDSAQRDYNVCQGTPHDLVSIANVVRAVSGKKLEIVVFNEGFNLPYTGDNTLLRSEFPGLSLSDLTSSINDLYEYYQKNRNLIDIDILSATK